MLLRRLARKGATVSKRSLTAAPPVHRGFDAGVNAHRLGLASFSPRSLECRFCSASAATSTSPSAVASQPKKKKKQQGLAAWLKDQVLHLWHGFRLLALNTRVTMRLKRQMMAGQKPTRRERQLLEKTTRDLLRLVPFSVFVIIPGGELLLPVALAIFPNLLPSTFTTTDGRRQKQIMDGLGRGIARRRLFEHMVTQIIYHERFSPDSKSMLVFRAMATDGVVDEAAIRSLAEYFDDGGPLALERLPRYVLRDLTIIAGISGTLSNRLKRILLPRTWYEAAARHAIDQEVDFRKKDDLSLSKVDLSKLTRHEAENECQTRRMRWFGPQDAMAKQLSEWLSLSLDPDIPAHMLLFIHPSSVPSAEFAKVFASQEERDRILGLAQFRDSAQVMWMRSMTEKCEAKEQEVKDDLSKIDKIPLDEIKQHIKEEQEELDACSKQFADLREAIPESAEPDLLALWDTLALKSHLYPSTDSTGSTGVKVAHLDKEIARYFSDRWTELGCSPQRVLDGFKEFDIDTSGVISRKDFEAFLKRIRAQ